MNQAAIIDGQLNVWWLTHNGIPVKNGVMMDPALPYYAEEYERGLALLSRAAGFVDPSMA